MYVAGDARHAVSPHAVLGGEWRGAFGFFENTYVRRWASSSKRLASGADLSAAEISHPSGHSFRCRLTRQNVIHRKHPTTGGKHDKFHLPAWFS